MLIRVRFFGELKEYMRRSQETLEIAPRISLRDFLMALTENDPTLLLKLMENGQPRSGTTILVNGRKVVHLYGLQTELEDRDVISTLHVAGGGGREKPQEGSHMSNSNPFHCSLLLN